ncbi:transposase family protein [Streptomyces beigongshangae]|uniref:transposase family protein n=1 Tax=Streptomyces beigongshangae TaxID=2841597 RepID=UPI003D3192A1
MESAACPGCGWRSSRVHRHYQRCLADRPVAGRRVRLDLRARRFVCANGSCERRTFAEQIPDPTHRCARRTNALTAQLTDIALFLGGRAGASLCGRMTVATGKDTLLRLLRAPRGCGLDWPKHAQASWRIPRRSGTGSDVSPQRFM